MSHDHTGHEHDHEHAPSEASPVHAEATNLSISDRELSPKGLQRRNFLRATGLLGAGAAAASVLGGGTPAMAETVEAGAVSRSRESKGGYLWLAGDHHIHTQYSPDAQYRVSRPGAARDAYGLDWMVITDHGSVAARQDRRREGQPGHPGGPRRTSRTRSSSRAWSGTSRPPSTAPCSSTRAATRSPSSSSSRTATTASVNNAGASTPTNEALAISGLAFLAQRGTAADASRTR